MKMYRYLAIIILSCIKISCVSLNKTIGLKFSKLGKSLFHNYGIDKNYSKYYKVSDRKLELQGTLMDQNAIFSDIIAYNEPDLVGEISASDSGGDFLYMLWKRNSLPHPIYINYNEEAPVCSVATSAHDALTTISFKNKLHYTTYDARSYERIHAKHSSAIKKIAFSPHDKYHVITPQKSSKIYWNKYPEGNIHAVFDVEFGEAQETIFNDAGTSMCVPAIDFGNNKTYVNLFDIKKQQLKETFAIAGLLSSGRRGSGQYVSSFYGPDDATLFINTQDIESGNLFSYLIDTRSGKISKITYPKTVLAIFEPVTTYVPLVYTFGASVAATVFNWLDNSRVDIKDEDGFTHAALNPEDRQHLVLANDDTITNLNLK